jgi:hypothetical protein
MQQDDLRCRPATSQNSFPTQYVTEAFADALLKDVRAHQAATLRLGARKSANAISDLLRTTLKLFRIAGGAVAGFWNIPTLGPGVRTDCSHTPVGRWNPPL